MIRNLVSAKVSTRLSWQVWYVWLLLLDNMHCLLDNMCWKRWLRLPSGRSRNFPLFASHQLNTHNQICRIRRISLSISSVSLHTFSIHRNLEDQEWNSLLHPNTIEVAFIFMSCPPKANCEINFLKAPPLLTYCLLLSNCSHQDLLHRPKVSSIYHPNKSP